MWRTDNSVVSKCRLFGLILIRCFAIVSAYVETSGYIRDLDRPIPLSHIEGVLNKKVGLPCDIQPLTAAEKVSMVLWFKESETEGKPVYSFDLRDRHSTSPKLWSAASAFGSRAYFRTNAAPAKLLVEGVKKSDAGVYRCRVDFENSPTRNVRVNFTVIVPPSRPTILGMKTQGTTKLLEPYNEGDTVELVCEVNGGEPKPNVTWYLENVVIDESFEHRGEVTINNLTFPNLGRQHLNSRLICQASNTKLAPPLNKVLILDVNLKPVSVQITSKNTALSAGKPHEIECRTTGSRPEATVTWWKGHKQIKRGIQTFSETNYTDSILTFIPEADDHEAVLTCQASNSRIPNAILKDQRNLNINFLPIVTLKLGSNLNPSYIKEGDDVYFECNVRANPKHQKLIWFKGDKEIKHNPSAGIILSYQSLVLQRVTRSSADNYSCSAINNEGSGMSNPVSLQVQYAPICKSSEGQVYGAMKHKTITLNCEVDSNPPPAIFLWTFNNSGEQYEVVPSTFKSSWYISSFNYTPVKDLDFGPVSCMAYNIIGSMITPCFFTLVAARTPTQVENCTVIERTSNNIIVHCMEGFDGGLPQSFYIEMLEPAGQKILMNTSSISPTFNITDTEDTASYVLKIFAYNARGKSDPTVLYTAAIRSPDKFVGTKSSIYLSPMLTALLAVAVLLAVSVCAVIVTMYRRQNGRNNNSDILYGNRDLHAIPVKPTENENSPSSKSYRPYKTYTDLDEPNPDIIPCDYGIPLNLDQEKLSTKDLPTLPSIYAKTSPCPESKRLPNRINKGVTARGAEISSEVTEFRPEVVTTRKQVQESCI